MMLPILISVSVAPVSYFFCASAPLQDAASTTRAAERAAGRRWNAGMLGSPSCENVSLFLTGSAWRLVGAPRSEEHTSELQSRGHLVCRLLLEKKKHKTDTLPPALPLT